VFLGVCLLFELRSFFFFCFLLSFVPLSGGFPLFIYLFICVFILKGYSAREGWLGGLLNNFIFKPLIKDLFNLPKADWKAAQKNWVSRKGSSVYALLCPPLWGPLYLIIFEDFILANDIYPPKKILKNFNISENNIQQKKNYGNSKYFTMQKYNLQKNPLKKPKASKIS